VGRNRKDRSTKIEAPHDRKPPRKPYKRLKRKTKEWLEFDEDDEFSQIDADEWYPFDT
jgi:hypothetical protein